MEIDFLTFCVFFFLASFLLAFVELAIKSKPISQADYEKTYGIPPGLDSLNYQDGEWRHKPTGRLATKGEVEGAGLVWPSTPPGSKSKTRSSREGSTAAGAAETAPGNKKSN